MSMHRAAPTRVLSEPRDRLALLALLVSVAGLLAAIPALPAVLRGILLGCFVLAGPGSAVLLYVPLPGSVALIVVPCVGVSAVALATLASTELIGLSPLLVLVVLAVGTSAAVWPRTSSIRRLIWR